MSCPVFTFPLCSMICAVFSLLPMQYTVQYSLYSISCAVFSPPLCTLCGILCTVFFVSYSPSPSHQINFNYCTDLSSCLVAPRKSIFCGIIILQNVFRISIAGEYCKSWLGINLMLSENCEIAPVMTK